jgi:hypothetical protein
MHAPGTTCAAKMSGGTFKQKGHKPVDLLKGHRGQPERAPKNQSWGNLGNKTNYSNTILYGLKNKVSTVCPY